MGKTLNLLVALAPALAAAALGFAIAVAPIVKRFWLDLIQSAERVEWLREIVSHVAFYGAVVGAILGLQHDSAWRVVVVAVWFVVMLCISFALTTRLEELKEAQERAIHRKRAGLQRSVVRSELERAATHGKDKSPG